MASPRQLRVFLSVGADKNIVPEFLVTVSNSGTMLLHIPIMTISGKQEIPSISENVTPAVMTVADGSMLRSLWHSAYL